MTRMTRMTAWNETWLSSSCRTKDQRPPPCKACEYVAKQRGVSFESLFPQARKPAPRSKKTDIPKKKPAPSAEVLEIPECGLDHSKALEGLVDLDEKYYFQEGRKFSGAKCANCQELFGGKKLPLPSDAHPCQCCQGWKLDKVECDYMLCQACYVEVKERLGDSSGLAGRRRRRRGDRSN